MKKVIEAIYTYTNSFDPYYLDDNISLEEKQEINKVMNLVEGKTLVSNDDIISSSVYIGDKYYTLLKIKKNKLDDEAQKFFNRGNREIIHGYLIEKSDISDNEYLIDYLDNVTVNDIKAIANEEEMRYEYEKPNITKISTDNFISKNLESINSDLNSNILANLLNFFYISRKQNKKLAIITDYDFVESLREYIKVLYKLFPAKLSNQISYSDYYRGKELIYDITILINDKSVEKCLNVGISFTL